MGLLTRALVPRGIRRAAHPVRTAKSAVTQRPIKQARPALNPIDNGIYSIERGLNTKPRKRSSGSRARERLRRTAIVKPTHRRQRIERSTDRVDQERPSPEHPSVSASDSAPATSRESSTDPVEQLRKLRNCATVEWSPKRSSTAKEGVAFADLSSWTGTGASPITHHVSVLTTPFRSNNFQATCQAE